MSQFQCNCKSCNHLDYALNVCQASTKCVEIKKICNLQILERNCLSLIDWLKAAEGKWIGHRIALCRCLISAIFTNSQMLEIRQHYSVAKDNLEREILNLFISVHVSFRSLSYIAHRSLFCINIHSFLLILVMKKKDWWSCVLFLKFSTEMAQKQYL